jgi:hypothetical protein
MHTQKQIAASRENGRKSHATTTPEGKARIGNANLQSGIFAETQVLIWEHEEDLQELAIRTLPRRRAASSTRSSCASGTCAASATPRTGFGSSSSKPARRAPTGAPMPSGKATRRSPASGTASTPPAAPGTPLSKSSNASKPATRTPVWLNAQSALTSTRPQPIRPKPSYKSLGVSVKMTLAVPPPAKRPPRHPWDTIPASESVFGIGGPPPAVRSTQGAK